MTCYFFSKNWQFHYSTCHKTGTKDHHLAARTLFTKYYTYAQKPSYPLLSVLKMGRYLANHKRVREVSPGLTSYKDRLELCYKISVT